MKPKVTRLNYFDEELGRIDLPNHQMIITRGIGSGLARLESDASRFWAIGDRGPNFKVSTAIKKFGMKNMQKLADQDGVKIMPMPQIGPSFSEMKIEGEYITIVRNIPIIDNENAPISGLPSMDNSGEIAVDLDGKLISADASGLDSEGIAAMTDGSFWIADEYCPSLVHVDRDGKIIKRLLPKRQANLFANSKYLIKETLPEIASKRHFNRGFEAVTISHDQKHLFVAFQSPLEHPDKKAFKSANCIRIWKITMETGLVIGQYIYPFDKAASFERDNLAGKFASNDIKVSELTYLSNDRLLVLERGSLTSKLYIVSLNDNFKTDSKHLEIEARPTIEQMDENEFGAFGINPLEKSLLFNSDNYEQICPDIEGVILLDEKTILIVNDNDFGVEGAQTQFWKIEFDSEI